MRRILNSDRIFWLGLLCLFYWIVVVINALYFNRLDWLLWYSSAGLGLTALALLSRNSFFITSMFCALFVIESIWGIGFLSLLIFNKSLYGLVEYAFSPSFSQKDFYIGLYHILIPIVLVLSAAKVPTHRYGWMGALLYTGVLAFSTYMFSVSSENVNCVFSMQGCVSFLKSFEWIENPYRLFVGLFLMNIFIFMPTNYVLHRIFNRALT